MTLAGDEVVGLDGVLGLVSVEEDVLIEILPVNEGRIAFTGMWCYNGGLTGEKGGIRIRPDGRGFTMEILLVKKDRIGLFLVKGSLLDSLEGGVIV